MEAVQRFVRALTYEKFRGVKRRRRDAMGAVRKPHENASIRTGSEQSVKVWRILNGPSFATPSK